MNFVHIFIETCTICDWFFCYLAGSERSFVNIGSKSFKRRYCYLRQEADGTYILEMYKDDKKGEAKNTIVMDFCTDVVKVDRPTFFFNEMIFN